MRTVQDRAFPGLGVALDPERMREALVERQLALQDGLAVEDVKITQVEYRPRKRCAVLYSVKLRRAHGGRSLTQLLVAELAGRGAPAPEVPADLLARYRESGRRPFRDPVVHLPALPLSARAFPLDPALPDLIDACDEQLMRTEFGRIWKERNVRVSRVAIRCLGYTPGARAAMLYKVVAHSRTTGLPEVRQVVGKLDAQREAADVFARNWAVWKLSGSRLRMAPPVGFLSRPNVFLQERVDGPRLSDLAGTGSFLGQARQTARAVAALHQMALPLRFRRAALPSVKAVKRWTGFVAAILPRERERIRRLGDRLIGELESRAVVTGPIHGDLHPSNLLVDDGRLTLIDLDNLTLGDRLLDVGRFLSALRTSSLRAHGTPDGLSDVGESFLEHYLRQTGEDERRARLFEAAALLTSAGTGFRLQRNGWEETACWFLDECERALAKSGAPVASRPRLSKVEMRRRDKAAHEARGVDHAAWSDDGQYLRGLLDPHVRREFGAEITRCRPRPKAGAVHGGHVRLHLSGWRGRTTPWRTVLDGHASRGSARSRFERLQSAFEALATVPEGPLIPRPIAFVPELSLKVVEAPRGASLLALLDRRRRSATEPDPDALAALGRVGRALAALHAAPIAVDAARAVRRTREELADVRESTAALASVHLDAAREADAILDRVAPLISAEIDRTAPTVKRFSLRRILLAGERIALREADDVLGAHPLLDAAELLAQIAFLRPDHDDAAALARSLRRSYLSRTGDAAALTAFETVALVRMARREWTRDRAAGVAERLLRAAAHRAEACLDETR